MTPTEATLTSRYADIRARLMGKPEPKRRELPRPEPVQTNTATIVPKRCKFAFDRPLAGQERWKVIVSEVCRANDVDPRHIIRQGRLKDKLAYVRFEIMYRMRTEITVAGEPMSHPYIGMLLGGIDHTTVLHGIKRHKQRAGIA